jgi:uncharacterized protein YcbK (DUF882 family)
MEELDFLNEISSNINGDDLTEDGKRFVGDFGRLKQAWINEHLSPEIQQHQIEFINQISKKLKNQQNKIEEEKESLLKSNLMQLELDKMNYVLKLYTKSRIQKVKKEFFFAFYQIKKKKKRLKIMQCTMLNKKKKQKKN